ncbi:MAG: hypothetical protein Q9159_004876 [Coniocarpon cinnabarinum]
MHLKYLSSALALIGAAHAWLPNEVQGGRLYGRDLPHAPGKTLRGRQGRNLFERRQAQQQAAPPHSSNPLGGPGSAPVTTTIPTGTAKTGGGGYGSTNDPSATSSMSATAVGSNPDARPTPFESSSIRGVNLGGLFVYEPWIAQDLWNATDCKGTDSEWACGSKVGQDAVNKIFQNHWATWYTQDDFDQMAHHGLNTVRIPTGFWMYEDIVHRPDEPYPQGGLEALAKICAMAKTAGLYIILDMHAAPGVQASNNSFAGKVTEDTEFYNTATDNYKRGEQYLGWITKQVHADPRFSNVGMLEVVNEPLQSQPDQTGSMISSFYPDAMKAIQDAEKNVDEAEKLTVMFMDSAWGAGDAASSGIQTVNTAYDDHRYLKWALSDSEQNPTAYASAACSDSRTKGQQGLPVVVGEWSLSAPLDNSQAQSCLWNPDDNIDWYKGWFAASMAAYEAGAGWIWWTWKTSGLNDPRWDWTIAVSKKIIPAQVTGVDWTASASSWCATATTAAPQMTCSQ